MLIVCQCCARKHEGERMIPFIVCEDPILPSPMPIPEFKGQDPSARSLDTL